MTTDTLIAEVLDEAERIVDAEWLRLLSTGGRALAAAYAKTPVAWPRPTLALGGAVPTWPGVPNLAAPRRGPAVNRGHRRVWPTQRSPPLGRRSGP